MNRISFQDTHVYPGCLAIFFFKIIPENSILAVVVEFSDGVIANAEVEQGSDEEVTVHIDGYETSSGTRIPKKAWRLRYDNLQDT